MRHLFQTYMFHMCYTCEACRFKIVPCWTASECSREHAYDEIPESDSVKISVASPRRSLLHYFGRAIIWI
jgi:hypothetical protein